MPDDRDMRKLERLRRRQGRVDERGEPVPTDEAAALGYNSGDDHAPKLLAHGRGHAARRILELAEEHDLPVRKDPTLVSILGALDVGAEIPPDLYGVIAEVLAWAYNADKAAGAQRRAA